MGLEVKVFDAAEDDGVVVASGAHLLVFVAECLDYVEVGEEVFYLAFHHDVGEDCEDLIGVHQRHLCLYSV